MGVDWPLYEKLLGNGRSVNKRDVVIEDAVNSFVSGMIDDPAYQAELKADGEITPMLASRTSTLTCTIKAPPNTDIHIGDMVECFNETWIVVELYVDKLGIINGIMWLCNNILRFQNRSTAVITRSCVVDDGSYSKKTGNADVYAMANTYKVYITLDEATKRLFVDKRLAFGRIYSSEGTEILEVYKIIGIDVKSKNFGEGSHLMVLTVQRDVYDASSDSLLENICDIFTDENISAPQTTGSCVITGRDVIRIGTSRKYTATFTNPNGEVESSAVAVWVVQAPEGIEYQISESECSITVPLKEDYVGETITLAVSDKESVFGRYEKKVQVITVG